MEKETKKKTASFQYGKQALVNHFKGQDSSVAKSLLQDDKTYTIKQAEDAINQWKKGELNG